MKTPQSRLKHKRSVMDCQGPGGSQGHSLPKTAKFFRLSPDNLNFSLGCLKAKPTIYFGLSGVNLNFILGCLEST